MAFKRNLANRYVGFSQQSVLLCFVFPYQRPLVDEAVILGKRIPANNRKMNRIRKSPLEVCHQVTGRWGTSQGRGASQCPNSKTLGSSNRGKREKFTQRIGQNKFKRAERTKGRRKETGEA